MLAVAIIKAVSLLGATAIAVALVIRGDIFWALVIAALVLLEGSAKVVLKKEKP